jgi:hypothetical protein
VSLSGDEIFVTARANRRDLVPVSLRRGRHHATGAGKTRARSNTSGETTPQMHLVETDVDVDGEAETMRIALRRSFEEVSAADVAVEVQESAAG